MICIVVFINMSSNLSIRYTHFLTQKSYIFEFQVLINLSAATVFPLLCVKYIFISLSCNHVLLICCKIHCIYLPMFCLVYIKTHLIFLEQLFLLLLVTVIAFLSFKESAPAYLLQMSHVKNQNLLLNLLINCISATSARQTLSIKDEYTFRFSNFLRIGLSDSLANCWFGIISL